MKRIFIRFNSMIIALMAILLFSGNAFANIGAPTFDPPGGTYASAQTVTINGSPGNFSIRYTIDGTDPTADYGMLYTDPITISVNTTLKAVQYQNNNHGNISDITTDNYFICGKCATCVAPVFNPGPGHYNSYQQVDITSGNGCTIRYTLDGSTPSHSNGIIYTDPVNITNTSTLKAISYKDGELDSKVTSGKYYIELDQVAKPTFSPVAGIYNLPQTVTIATSTSGASIMYTLDGTTPSQSHGILYTSPITISVNKTLKAMAFKYEMLDSDVKSGDYIITKVATPTFNPLPGTFNTPQSVAISCITEGAMIRYTTDGTNPSIIVGTIYTGPVAISSTTTLKAIAYLGAMIPSSIASGTYTIDLLPVADPTFSPAEGTYGTAQSVTISTTTSGATIRYTTDGSIPSATNGAVYSSPVTISQNTTLKAIAYKDYMLNSNVITGTYNIQCAAPAFSPLPGIFSSTQSVTITSSTTGATIKYTTDGSDPSNGTTLTNGGTVTISQNTTLKAIAVKSGMTNSEITSGDYGIKCAIPVFNPPAGTYSTVQSVSISSSTPGVTIKYTTDGSTPSQSNGTTYTTPVAISSTTTLKAIAFKTGMTDSEIASGIYTINLAPVSAPVFTPGAGTFSSAQSVIITTGTAGASIRYTTDGTEPTATTGTLYSGAVTISQNTTLKAIAYKDGMLASTVTTGVYNIKCVAPVFDPASGDFTSAQPVTMTSATSGASIYYTTDGSVPTHTTGTLYTGPVNITQNTTLKAIAWKDGMTESDVTSGTYNIQCATPIFNPTPGNYSSAQLVTITSATSNATIKYTTDGSEPSQTNGLVYSSPVSLNSNTTLKAIAFKTGMLDSQVASGIYTITLEQVAAPSFTPAAGTYTGTQSVTIASATSGASIYYTTNGSEPTSTNGTLYSSPVTLSQNTTLRAKAYKDGMTESTVTSGIYTIKCVAPEFSPAPGTYTSAQSVTITSATAGATIRYTTDGTTPSQSNGQVYSSPVSISANTTLQAIAYKSGMNDSEIASGMYVIQSGSPCAITKINGGGFTTTLTSVVQNGSSYVVVLTVEHDGCNGPVCKELSHYSVEGLPGTYSNVSVQIISGNMTYSNIDMGPNLGASTPFQGFKIDGTHGIGDGQAGKFTITYMLTSLQAEQTLAKAGQNYQIAAFTLQDFQTVLGCTVPAKVATPTFTPLPGTYASAQNVTIACTTAGATIKYTIDGTEPSRTNGIIYTGPVSINSTTTLKAIAYKDGMTDSDVASGLYTIQLEKVAAPVFTPAAGTYTTAQSVTITSTTTGATIRYTLDGSTPTPTNGIVYTTPVSIASTDTLKAIAYKTGMTDSDVTSGIYIIQAKVATPAFSPVPGTYATAQTVTLSCATAGATIKYTIDGTNPSATNGIIYTIPLTIGSNITIKVYAYKTGMTDSDMATGAYIIQGGSGNDSDGDGVPDNEDDYPLDPTRAFDNYYPANGNGSLAFEDLWPGKGDYDMNDVVTDYRFKTVTNAQNQLVEVFPTFIVKASGAELINGFGFQLANTTIPSSAITVTGYDLRENFISLNSGGTEAGQEKATIIVFDNIFNLLPPPGVGIGVNTTPDAPYVNPDTMSMHLVFTPNTYTYNQLDIANFNPFIIVNSSNGAKVRGHEVHLPDYPPTSLADNSLFGTAEDNSIPAENRYYKTSNNLPWAINIYESFDYPKERVDVLSTYLHFADWAQSGGTLYPDWYKNLSGYRNTENIYTHAK